MKKERKRGAKRLAEDMQEYRKGYQEGAEDSRRNFSRTEAAEPAQIAMQLGALLARMPVNISEDAQAEPGMLTLHEAIALVKGANYLLIHANTLNSNIQPEKKDNEGNTGGKNE